MADKENHEADVERKKAAVWHEQTPLMNRFYQGCSKFAAAIGNLDEAFLDNKECVCCIDEGTAHMEMNGKLGLAGSGILYPGSSWEERLEKVSDICFAKGITKVTSHEGCGAAGLAAKRDSAEGNPDEYGKKWARELQERLNERRGVNGSEDYVHISSAEMKRPPKFHNARTVWFDLTGRFNPDKLGESVPPGFLIDGSDAERLGTSAEEQYPLTELAVAVSIAFGNHGFGKLFDGKNKFVITIVAPDAIQLTKMRLFLESFIAAKLGEELKKINSQMDDEKIREIIDAIKIDGFISPKK